MASLLAVTAFSQALETSPAAVRVNVTVNPDGSRTTYEFDSAHQKATATTTQPDGRMREKVRYKLDEAGRFASGEVFGPDGKFRFHSLYKYDASGRMLEEAQSGKEGNLQNKIVYSYDGNGRPTGYSIFDGSGKLLGRVSSASPTPPSVKTPKGR